MFVYSEGEGLHWPLSALGFQIMKASLLVDEEDLDLILDHRFGKQPTPVDASQEICSPRVPISSSTRGRRSRSSGTVRLVVLVPTLNSDVLDLVLLF